MGNGERGRFCACACMTRAVGSAVADPAGGDLYGNSLTPPQPATSACLPFFRIVRLFGAGQVIRSRTGRRPISGLECNLFVED